MEEHASTRPLNKHKRRRPPYRHYESHEEDEAPRSRRKRGRSKLPYLLALLAVVVWFLPWLAAKTPLAGMLIARATKDINGSVRIADLTLGWFSPVTIEGLEIRDAAGDPLLKAAKITSGKRLYSWITNRSDLGQLKIDDPQAQVVFEKHTNNFATTFAKWLASDPQAPPKSIIESLAAAGIGSFDFEVTGGSATIVDRALARRCAVQSLNGSARLISAVDGLRGKLRGDVDVDDKLSPFDAAWEIVAPGHGDVQAGSNKFSVASSGFPLWLVGASLQGVAPGLELDGRLVSKLDVEWRAGTAGIEQATAKGEATAEQLLVAGPWLKGDRLQLASAKLPIAMSVEKNNLRVEQLGVDCELGQLSFNGDLDMAAGLAKSLTSKPYHVIGHLDVARLAAMLPNTVHLRSDTRITAGVIDLALDATARNQGLGWQGRLETSQLSATTAGKQVTWEKPIAMTFSAHESGDGIVIERLYAEADFLELQGEGTPADGQVSASFDLDRLSRELGRFVDLGELKMAGNGTAHATWQRQANGALEATAQVDAQNFEMSRPGARPWQEARIDVVADVTARMDGTTITRVDRGDLRVSAGPDVLQARLEQPVLQVNRQGLWPVLITLRGELARWLPRVEPWIGSHPEYTLAGNCDLTADVVYSATGIELEPVTAKIQNFQLHGPAAHIDEPMVELNAQSTWDAETRELIVQDARWASSALVAQAKNMLVALDPKQTPSARGQLQYNGDLGRLWRWFDDPQSPSNLQLAGRMTGSLNVQRAGDITTAAWDNTIDRFAANVIGGASWQEPQLRLVSHMEHDGKRELLRLSDFAISSQAFQTTANGQIDDLAGRRNLQLQGRVRYDLARLQPMWQQWTGTGVRFEGVDEQPFSVSGPLRSLASTAAPGNQPGVAPSNDTIFACLQGNASAHWNNGSLYGFPLGSGDLRTQLANGVLNFNPIDVTASQGRLHLAPTIRLSPSPMLLTVARGRMAEQVHITPEMCESALKYIAPVLAGVTQAQGQFSIDLDGCSIPLASPKQGDLAGRFTVHSVQIGPGPLVQELAVLMNRGAPAALTRESVVDFRMVQGRIYHRGLELVFPEFTLKTYGSVGLDESLAIMAELPIPPKWLGNNSIGQALQGQTIQLPIGGTLKNPKIDQKALSQANAQLFQNTATGILKQELFKGLDKVLGPPK